LANGRTGGIAAQTTELVLLAPRVRWGLILSFSTSSSVGPLKPLIVQKSPFFLYLTVLGSSVMFLVAAIKMRLRSAAHWLFSNRYTVMRLRAVCIVAVIISSPLRLSPRRESISSTSSHCHWVGSRLCSLCSSMSLSLGLSSSNFCSRQNP